MTHPFGSEQNRLTFDGPLAKSRLDTIIGEPNSKTIPVRVGRKNGKAAWS